MCETANEIDPADELPIVDPTAFDLIVVGTGLQESILAGAAAKAGKTVLHIDPAPHYGAHWATLTLDQFLAWAQKQSGTSVGERAEGPAVSASFSESDHVVPPSGMRVYSDVVIERHQGGDLGSSHQYSIDLAPKAVFCEGPLIRALLKSGAHHSLEFKLVQATHVWQPHGSHGSLMPVPASRAAVFRDRSLGPADKRLLMRFLTNAAQAIEGQGPLQDAFGEQPFVELLQQEGLSPQLRGFVLYALALLAEDQEPHGAVCDAPVTARDGREALACYFAALGKYGAGTGALMVPLYGGGEIAQAFCRVAAVAGAMYILRCPLRSLHRNQDTRAVAGVELASGQVLPCERLVGNVDTLTPLLPETEFAHRQGVSRAVCILDTPLQEGESQTLVIIPPRALPSVNPNAIHALQVGNSTRSAPEGRYLLYLSTPSSASSAAEDLRPAVSALLQPPEQDPGQAGQEGGEETGMEASSGNRPRALAVIYFRQSTGAGGQTLLGDTAACCALPDAAVGFDDAVVTAERLFRQLWPDLEMFKVSSEDPALEDDESDEESVSALEAALGRLGSASQAPSHLGEGKADMA